MGKYLDAIGVSVFWAKIKTKITEVVTEEIATYAQQFNDIKEQALTASNNAENYYNLTKSAIDSLNSDAATTLTYAQLVAKHGDAITKIAQQLGSTYNNEGLEASDNYIPGFIITEVTQEEMDSIIKNGTIEDNKIYLVQE